MPTWRKGIMGNIVAGIGNTRTINSDFMNTPYAKHWSDFLNSDQLREMVQKHNYKIIFAPHANIVPYLKTFKVPEYINVWWATSFF